MRLRTPFPLPVGGPGLPGASRDPGASRAPGPGDFCWRWATAPQGKGSRLCVLCLVPRWLSYGRGGQFTLSKPFCFVFFSAPALYPSFILLQVQCSASVFIRAFSNFYHPFHSLSVPAVSFLRGRSKLDAAVKMRIHH